MAHFLQEITMAERTVNKSALAREYLQKYPDKRPSEIARLITEEKQVDISTKFVATIKTNLKHGVGKREAAAPAAASTNRATTKGTAKTSKGEARKAKAKAATAAPGMSHHIANLKAAVQALGKDQARKIIELF
jgi:hypothetical protein